jgi:single-strand DNA-binding protein
MKVTNKGYINFNDKYNKKTNTMMTASMSFSNGKEDDGEWKNGYINVIAFRDNIQQLESSVGQLVEIEGTFRLNEYTNQQGQSIKTPQIIIDTFLNGSASKSNNYSKNEKPPFTASSPIDIDDLDLPF